MGVKTYGEIVDEMLEQISAITLRGYRVAKIEIGADRLRTMEDLRIDTIGDFGTDIKELYFEHPKMIFGIPMTVVVSLEDGLNYVLEPRLARLPSDVPTSLRWVASGDVAAVFPAFTKEGR